MCVIYIILLHLSQMTLDYQYIDPGPDDPASSKNRYFALNASSLQFLLCIEKNYCVYYCKKLVQLSALF